VCIVEFLLCLCCILVSLMLWEGSNGLLHRRWVEGDALDLPFMDGWFDAITMGYGLRNVVDKHKAMQEIFRVLRAGRFCISIH